MKEASKEFRNTYLERICHEIDNAVKNSPNNNGRIPYGFVSKILKQTSIEESWVNPNMINFAYKKLKRTVDITPATFTSTCCDGNPAPKKNKGGGQREPLSR